MVELAAFASPAVALRAPAAHLRPQGASSSAAPIVVRAARSAESTSEGGYGLYSRMAAAVGAAVQATRKRLKAPRTSRAQSATGSESSSEEQTVSFHRIDSQTVLESVQAHFVDRLEAVTADGVSSKGDFAPSSWLRDAGEHGGGKRYGVVDVPLFNRASVNYSAVHYDDVPEKPVKSATALSVIIHPRNPHAPSMHCHFSYTEPRTRAPYWRMISDLNPSLHDPHFKNTFEKALKRRCPEDLFDDGKLFGDKYFFIPELNMYRGTSHLFIAELADTEMDPNASRELAKTLAITTIDTYTDIIQTAMDAHPADTVTDAAREQQLAYHTAYFYQVLFLDCGTTAGLLAHSENDVGTLASLPNYISPKLLRTWLEEKVQPPHDVLLNRILEVLPEDEEPCHVTDEIRANLAATVRDYYVEDRTRTKAQADMDLAWWAKRAEVDA